MSEHIRSFANVDDLLAYLNDSRANAVAAMKSNPSLVRLCNSSDTLYFKREIVQDGPWWPERYTIYGEVPSLAATLDRERRYYPREMDPASEDAAEFAAISERMTAARTEEGYLYGEWYSTVVPGGEPGSHHVTALTLINADEFNAAKANGWTA